MSNSRMHPCDFCKLIDNGYDNCYDCSFGFMDSVECYMHECAANHDGSCTWGVSGKCKARHQEDFTIDSE